MRIVAAGVLAMQPYSRGSGDAACDGSFSPSYHPFVFPLISCLLLLQLSKLVVDAQAT